jgi:hypothetical protein
MSESPETDYSPEQWRTQPDSAALNYQEAKEMAAPIITVIGTLKDGSRVVKGDWDSATSGQVSERTLAAIAAIGITVSDEPDKYLF